MKSNQKLLFITLLSSLLMSGCTSSINSEEPSSSIDDSSITNTNSSVTSTTNDDSSSSSIEDIKISSFIYVDSPSYVTVNFINENIDINNKIEEGTLISFSLTVLEHYHVNSVIMNEQQLILRDECYSFIMPNEDANILIQGSEDEKYNISTTNAENISFSIAGQKQSFYEGEEVIFSVAANYGYQINSFEIIKDSDLSKIEYSGSSSYSFIMPNSNVTINFDVETLYQVTINNSDHINVLISNERDYYSYNEQISFTLSNLMPSSYELDKVEIIDKDNNIISYSLENDVYSFNMPKSNVVITITEKEIIKSQDPFLTKTSFEGTYDYYDGSYDYVNRLRIVFNGDKTLSWYMTYESQDYWDEWANPNNNGLNPLQPKYSAPSDMQGDGTRHEHKNIPYTYDDSLDQIIFETPVNSTTCECTLQINRSGESIVSITILNNMPDSYLACKNVVLSKI